MSDENKIYIRDLNNYSFYIPNYQRGYKWSEKNIKDLLNDINSIGKDDKKDHCLHNLTIIENDGKYEVVDGQQRLTTIFLLLKYLGYEEIYNLDYQIREETKHFINNKLETIINNISNYDNGIDIFKSVKDETIYIEGTNEKSSYNKQDIYFICDVLFHMHQWFINNTGNKISDNLQKVYFYKHKLENIKGETVFANLNSGRVPLTDIELIKADLIISISEEKNKSKDNDILLNEIRSNIGRLWDEMESFLAQDEVWYWIAANNKSANKLSLLFDLINIKTFKDYKDILENKENNKTSNDILNKIKDYYYTIKDWYYDNDMYHLVGVAVNIDISIKDLLPQKTDDGKYKLKSKYELKNKIIQSIIKEISIREHYGKIKLNKNQANKDKYILYEDLSYQNNNNSNNKYIEKIMLLLNCLEGFNFDKKTFNEGFRYRFDLHNKEQWSIEHIFPQNATKDNYKSYILDLIFLFKEEDKELELKSILNELHINDDIINNREELKKVLDDKKDIDINKIKEISDNMQFMDIQSMGNLALLSKNINSSLKNDIFEEKRDKLLKKLSEENIFIPPLTFKVFSKNFDGAERTKEYWTPNDFDTYLNYQKEQLKKILNLLK
uniref:DUF262 domain-containing protein n=1 Tax=Brachyspira catarrhinii TaxID=2528966 RepID=UPI003F4BB9FA